MTDALLPLGVQLDTQTFAPGENYVPAQDTHLIGIHTGAPLEMLQVRDGQSIRRLFMPGDLVVIPAGLPNLCEHHVPASGLYLSLTPELVRSTAARAELDPSGFDLVNHFGTQDPLLLHLAQALHGEQGAGGLGGRLYIESLITQLTIHLLRGYAARTMTPAPPAALSHEQVRRVVGLIRERLSDDLSLEMLANSVHLSPFHFSRAFKAATGAAPHQFVLAERVERAKRLLSSTRLSAAEVAAEVGFSDQSHLTRHFKRRTGQTPGEYARKNIQR